MSSIPSGSPFDPSARTPAKPGPPDEWIALLDKVTNHITDMAGSRLTWTTVRDIAAQSRAVTDEPYFLNWVGANYATAMAMGVRRMADRNDRAVSLHRLLVLVAAEPQKLTREWFCSDVFVGMVDSQDQAFARLADPNGLGHVDPEIVNTDLDALAVSAHAVRRYVNEYVAHAQARPTAAVPTFADLHQAVDDINLVFRKYVTLLARADRQIEPVFQFPWARVFDRAWREP